MGILRRGLRFEEAFTRIPNTWVRDKRLTRRARGLLAEIMSHSVGYRITVQQLIANGPEGRDAIYKALAELKDAGYLEVTRERRADGTRGPAEYAVTDPGDDTTSGYSGSGATSGESGSGVIRGFQETPDHTTSVKTTSWKSAHIEEQDQEDQDLEDQDSTETHPGQSPTASTPPATDPVDNADGFNPWAVQRAVVEHCGVEITQVQAARLAGMLIERASEAVSHPTAFITACIRRDPSGILEDLRGAA